MNYINISPYTIVKFDINLEIYNKLKTLSIRRLLIAIDEYNPIFNYLDYSDLSDDHYLYPIENTHEKKCIFCHKTSNEITFIKKPHVIPFLLGNSFLLHHEECDECNTFFGEVLECELDKYLKPHRTLNRLKNRKGNLINTIISGERSFKFNETSNSYDFKLQEEEFHFVQDSNTITFKIKQEKHSPMLVYKAFMKIFFGLLPRNHLYKFEKLRKWIIERNDSLILFSPLNVIKTRLEGFSTSTLDVIIFHKETSTLEQFKMNSAKKEDFEYLGYIRFGSIVIEVPLFTDLNFEKLKYMSNHNIKPEFSFPNIPKPGFPQNYELLDFSETRRIKTEEKMFFSFEKITENEII